jgi:hypothetical protein
MWFPKRFKRVKTQYIYSAIDSHNEMLQKTNDVLDKAIAAFDGESDWFTCYCVKGNKDDNTVDNKCKHSSN